MTKAIRTWPQLRAAATAFSVLVSLSTTIAQAQQPIKLTIASRFPPVLPFMVETQQTLMPAVNEALERSDNKYKIEWITAFGGTLASYA